MKRGGLPVEGEWVRWDMRLPELWRLASMLRLFLTASRERRLVRGARLGMLCLNSSGTTYKWNLGTIWCVSLQLCHNRNLCDDDSDLLDQGCKCCIVTGYNLPSLFANLSSSALGPWRDRLGVLVRGAPSRLLYSWPWLEVEGDRHRGEPKGEGVKRCRRWGMGPNSSSSSSRL